ncbi:MAG: hypothetical protein RMM53_01655 [Bacteroidia bacterium]|nr:hypothetical protein [Bacteroidia bacterium]
MIGSLSSFLEMYSNRPMKNNQGGMAAPHSFASWFICRMLRPTHIVESGVWYGHGTWVLEQAAPSARFHCIDPLADYVKYRPKNAVYYKKDFFHLNWDDLPRDTTLLFFDDHQNAMERLKYCQKIGFKHIIFEDNYPPCAGDCYSLKKALQGSGFVPHEFPTFKFKHRIIWLFRAKLDFYKGLIKPNGEDAQWIRRHVKIYYEFPPVYQSENTRWGWPWQEPMFLGPPPLLTELEERFRLFYDEAQSYTWLCYVRL